MTKYSYFINVRSGLVLDAYRGLTTPGPIVQYPAHPTRYPENQLWSYTVDDEGSPTAIVNKKSKLVLDVACRML